MYAMSALFLYGFLLCGCFFAEVEMVGINFAKNY